jgi:RNA polymerase sigma-70 factor (ECF subfamily)
VDPDARAGFEQLFRETRTDLLAYVMRRSQSTEDAADVLAETYLIAWQKLDAIPRDERARLWLFGVARNLLLKGASRHRSRHALVERLAGELRRAHPSPASAQDERSSALHVALGALPERDREILMLTAWEGPDPEANRRRRGNTGEPRASTSAPGPDAAETRPHEPPTADRAARRVRRPQARPIANAAMPAVRAGPLARQRQRAQRSFDEFRAELARGATACCPRRRGGKTAV